MRSILNEQLQQPEYLGDAVYVGHDGYHVWIGANAPVGTIALEPMVLRGLLEYAKKVGFKVEDVK